MTEEHKIVEHALIPDVFTQHLQAQGDRPGVRYCVCGSSILPEAGLAPGELFKEHVREAESINLALDVVKRLRYYGKDNRKQAYTMPYNELKALSAYIHKLEEGLLSS